MKVSPIEEYGLRCLLSLSRNREGAWSIEAIAQREGLSKAYVAKIIMLLRKSGLVQSARGRFGGVSLTRSPGEITVAQALQALNGPLYRATACDDFAQGDLCEKSYCSIRGMWQEIALSVNNVLENKTLEDLLHCESNHVEGNQPPCFAEAQKAAREPSMGLDGVSRITAETDAIQTDATQTE